MRREGYPAVAIHGDKAQMEREAVLQGWCIALMYRKSINHAFQFIPLFFFFFFLFASFLVLPSCHNVSDFKSGRAMVLVATDVAARGLGE
jgi:hypothetical protein